MTGAIATNRKVELKELTAVRGFAALAVVIFHVDSYCGEPLQSLFPIDLVGMLAVDFFFVLSGFVLAHVYQAAWDRGDYSHGDFLVRRFARVWPLHFACLMGIGFIVLAGGYLGMRPPWQPDLPSFMSHLFLLNATGVSSELSWNQPSWSVGAEWTAYLLFPLYLIICSTIRPAWANLAISVGLLVTLHIAVKWVAGLELLELNANGGSIRIVPSFFAGIALRQVYGGGIGASISRQMLCALLVATLLTGLLLLAFGAPSLALWPVIPALIYLLALQARHEGHFALRARALTWLGEVSYGLYLVHSLVLMVVFGVAGKLIGLQSPVTTFAIGAGSIVLAVLAAAIAHYAIERPAQALILKWSKRRKHRALLAANSVVEGQLDRGPAVYQFSGTVGRK